MNMQDRPDGTSHDGAAMARAAVSSRTVAVGPMNLPGTLTWPPLARSLVLFAHGAGSGRTSPRNRSIADELHAAGYASLLFDLLTEEEAEARQTVFNIDLLSDRLLQAVRWAQSEGAGRVASKAGFGGIGLYGASTGAAAALRVAARAQDLHLALGAVVCRGGRVDLANGMLDAIQIPCLFIVGGSDELVLELNRAAFARLCCEKSMVIVPGAGHLFEESGAMDSVARHTVGWFSKHLPGPRS